MSYFEHLVACKQAEDAAYKIEQAEKAKHDARIAELDAEVSRLKTTLSDRESTIVSQQEELWKLRNFSQGNVHSSSYIAVLQRAEKAESDLSALQQLLTDAPTMTMHVIDNHTVSHFCPENILDLEEGGQCVVRLVKEEVHE